MFETLFRYPRVLARQVSGPCTEDRRRYLTHCAEQGYARTTLKALANELLVVAERLSLEAGSVTLPEIKVAANRWARFQQRRHRSEGMRWSRERFVQSAKAWCQFLGYLKAPPVERPPFAIELADFSAYMLDERGLSSKTVINRCWHAKHFLQDLDGSNSIADSSLEDADA